MSAPWPLKSLDEVATVFGGSSAPQGEHLFEEGTHPFIRTADVGRIGFGEIFETKDYLNEMGIEKLRHFKKGTILIPKSGASTFLNHRVIMGMDAYVASHLAGIKADEAIIDTRYLLYALSRIKAQDLLQENAYPSLNLSLIKGIEIPVPPLEEQQQIVSILDEAFDYLNSLLVSNRHSDLKDLRYSGIAELQSKAGGPIVQLGSVASVVSGSGFPKEFQGELQNEIPFLKVSDMNLEGNEVYITRSNNTITEETRKLLKAKLIPAGCIIFPKIGGAISTNKKRILTKSSCIDNNVVAILPRASINTDFLYHAFLITDLYELSSKAALPSIKSSTLAAFEITAPNLEVQRQCAAQTNFLLEDLADLELKIAERFDLISEFRRSILQEAFNGRLTGGLVS
jgi:type I restriction enzyme S subunit